MVSDFWAKQKRQGSGALRVKLLEYAWTYPAVIARGAYCTRDAKIASPACAITAVGLHVTQQQRALTTTSDTLLLIKTLRKKLFIRNASQSLRAICPPYHGVVVVANARGQCYSPGAPRPFGYAEFSPAPR